jgi:uncharacterized protein (TIGR03067 family)
MRPLFVFILLLFTIACATQPKIGTGSKKLNGTWVPVKQVLAGNVLPKAYYAKQKMIIRDSTYVVEAESMDRGKILVRKNKIDIYGKEGVNKGRHFTAIYKIENNQLIICYNLGGIGFPESFETEGKPLYFLSIFELKEK